MKRTAITLFAAIAFALTLGFFASSGTASAQTPCSVGTYVPFVGNVPCPAPVSGADGFILATSDRYDISDSDGVVFGGNPIKMAPSRVATLVGIGGADFGGAAIFTPEEIEKLFSAVVVLERNAEGRAILIQTSNGGVAGLAAPSPSLAVTGSETTTPVILGAALIAIGGLAVISSKRREIES